MIARGLLAFVLVVLSVGCGGGGSDASPGPASGLEPAARGLCEAIALTGEADVVAAEAAFQDRVHRYLHDLAARVATFDRRASGDLLVAKQRVESALASGAGAGELHASMTDLYVALVRAAEADGLTAPACEEAKA